MDILRGERLREAAPKAIGYASSVKDDFPLVRPVIKINQAHMVMLVEEEIVSVGQGKKVLSALDSIPSDLDLDAALEDVHMNIEAEVIRKAGIDAGGQLNLGKSRNDQVSAAIRITLRGYLLEIASAIAKLQKVLLKKASSNLGTLMPGYTHLQHAQPTTLAHHLLAYYDAFSRDAERIMEAYERVNLSPMGAVALSTTTFPINRDAVAKLLGFHGIIENSLDAVSTRDFALESLAAMTITMTDLSRLAEEVILWSSQEWRAVELPEAYSSTSSIMPQKKNPVVAELVRAKAGSAMGYLNAALGIVKALPYSYNLDIQELTPHLWASSEDCLQSLLVFAELLAKLKFMKGRLRVLVEDSSSTATDLAEALVQEFSIPFRKAHLVVGALSKTAADTGRSLKDVGEERLGEVTARILGKELVLGHEKLEEVLDPWNSVQRRRVLGGPGPSSVLTMIKERKSQSLSLLRLLTDKKRRLDASMALLDERIAVILQG